MVTSLHINPRDKFSPSQACIVLGVSRRTIYNAMDAGEISFVLTPKDTRRITGAALIKYFNRH